MNRRAGGFRVDRRKLLITAGAAAALAAGALGIASQVGDLGAAAEALRQADVRWLPLCPAGQLLAYLGYALAYREAAGVDGGPRLPCRLALKVVVAGFGAHVVGAAPGALAVEYWALTRAGAAPREAARRVLAFNTLEWAVLAVGACIAAAAALAGLAEDVPFALALPWLAAPPAAIMAALALSRWRRAQRLAELRAGPAAGRLRRLAAKAARGLGDVVASLVLVRRLAVSPLRHPGALAGFALYWAGDLVTLYAALRAFEQEVSLDALVLAYATGYLATGLPLPAGGIGGIEASMALSLKAVGVGLAPAFLAVVLYRVFTFWLPALPAVAFLPVLRRLDEELPRIRRKPDGEALSRDPAPSARGR